MPEADPHFYDHEGDGHDAASRSERERRTEAVTTNALRRAAMLNQLATEVKASMSIYDAQEDEVYGLPR